MHKLLTATSAIILGIMLLAIGFGQFAWHEHAKDNGDEVDAVIVEIKERSDEDSASVAYTVYADYVVNGKAYEHVRVARTRHEEQYAVGQSIKVLVSPLLPWKTMSDGGPAAFMGGILAVGGVVAKKAKRTERVS